MSVTDIMTRELIDRYLERDRAEVEHYHKLSRTNHPLIASILAYQLANPGDVTSWSKPRYNGHRGAA